MPSSPRSPTWCRRTVMASLALTLTDYTGEVLWQHKLWRTSPSVRLAALAVVALVALPTALVATIASKAAARADALASSRHTLELELYAKGVGPALRAEGKEGIVVNSFAMRNSPMPTAAVRPAS